MNIFAYEIRKLCDNVCMYAFYSIINYKHTRNVCVCSYSRSFSLTHVVVIMAKLNYFIVTIFPIIVIAASSLSHKYTTKVAHKN